jgi:hypothetical protein
MVHPFLKKDKTVDLFLAETRSSTSVQYLLSLHIGNIALVRFTTMTEGSQVVSNSS